MYALRAPLLTEMDVSSVFSHCTAVYLLPLSYYRQKEAFTKFSPNVKRKTLQQEAFNISGLSDPTELSSQFRPNSKQNKYYYKQNFSARKIFHSLETLLPLMQWTLQPKQRSLIYWVCDATISTFQLECLQEQGSVCLVPVDYYSDAELFGNEKVPIHVSCWKNSLNKLLFLWSSLCGSEDLEPCTVSVRMQVHFLASLSRLRIRHCHKLWCRLKMWLRSGIAQVWCRPTAAAPIGPLAWALPCARSVAVRRK